MPLALLSLSGPASPPSPLLPSPPLLCLSLGFARCAVSAMGLACGKAAVDPPAGSIGQYHTAHHQPQQPQPPASNIHYASSAFNPSSPGTSTTSSGIIIYPMYDTSSPIVSRRVDISGFKVKTSFDAGSAATNEPTAAHSTVDANMLKQQMQVLSRLKSHSHSTTQHSVADTNGVVLVAGRTESPSVSSEGRVAQTV